MSEAKGRPIAFSHPAYGQQKKGATGFFDPVYGKRVFIDKLALQRLVNSALFRFSIAPFLRQKRKNNLRPSLGKLRYYDTIKTPEIEPPRQLRGA